MSATVKIEGTLSENLVAALRSATRLRARKVYPETLVFWNELLQLAHERLCDGDNDPTLSELAAQLQNELSARQPS